MDLSSSSGKTAVRGDTFMSYPVDRAIPDLCLRSVLRNAENFKVLRVLRLLIQTINIIQKKERYIILLPKIFKEEIIICFNK
jgi:hypothetical protein